MWMFIHICAELGQAAGLYDYVRIDQCYVLTVRRRNTHIISSRETDVRRIPDYSDGGIVLANSICSTVVRCIIDNKNVLASDSSVVCIQ
jgi:hypothetical protein